MRPIRYSPPWRRTAGLLRPAWTFLSLALIALRSVPAAGADRPCRGDPPWSELRFKASKGWARASVVLRLEPWSPPGGGVEAVDPGRVGRVIRGRVLTVETTVRGLFLGGERYEERIWFDGADGRALGRSRRRYGRKSWRKEYRWAPGGVRRRLFRPAGEGPVTFPFEPRAGGVESVYPLGEGMERKGPVRDPTYLFYLLSSIPGPEEGQGTIRLVAFGRRNFYRLELRPESPAPLKVSYQVRSSVERRRVKGRIEAVQYGLAVEPLTSGRGKPETFSLLGLQEEIRIWLDLVLRLPVRVSGIQKGTGRWVFDLKEARLWGPPGGGTIGSGDGP